VRVGLLVSEREVAPDGMARDPFPDGMARDPFPDGMARDFSQASSSWSLVHRAAWDVPLYSLAGSSARTSWHSRARAKLQRALELGAATAFDSRGDWLAEVLEWTGGEGVDLVHVAVGAPRGGRAFRAWLWAAW
jgi:hypothetical protein